jgi:predicted acyltransferase
MNPSAMNPTALVETVPVRGDVPAALQAARPPPARLQSLDAYRGLIMLTLLAGAIFHSLKGHPIWNWLYVQNDHAAWEGCVYWDLIQPSFIFMVGVAMPFALARRVALGDSWGKRFRHVLLRALNLVLIGILLDNFGAEKWSIGFIRVLQQIAIGYVLAFFVVERGFRTQALVAAAILVGYNLLWMFNPWNGPGGPWAKGNENIGSAFDMWLLGRYYSGYYVGMNAIPSTATIIFGVMVGQLIMNRLPPRKTMLILLITGVSSIALGLAASPWLPLIKRIWTPSFAVYAGGWTTLMLLFFYWSVEVMGWTRWAFPLVVVGMNSIAAYVLGNAFGGWFRSASNAWIGWLKEPLGAAWFPVFQKFLFMCAAWAVLYWLYRRKIFFKA